MEPNFIEMTGETVEEAIAKGLEELGVSPAQVMIEVLDEPSEAMFGSAPRLARVRLQLMGGRPASSPATFIPSPPAQDDLHEMVYGDEDAPYSEPPHKQQGSPPPKRDEAPRREPRADRTAEGRRGDRDRGQGERGDRGQRQRDARGERPPRESSRAADRERKPVFEVDIDDKDEELPILYQPDEVPESEQDEEAQVSKVVLNEILERMGVRAQVFVLRAQPGEDGGKSPWVLDIGNGRNLSRLIGRRGETLASLQYLTRLVASRELQRRVDIVVDVESYKVKRAGTLHSLALRMASEAIAQKRTITLEPMPPHERRIIHLALRGRTDVTTKSLGEGSARKVTIIPQSDSE